MTETSNGATSNKPKPKRQTKPRNKSLYTVFINKITSWQPFPGAPYPVEEVSPIVRRILLVVTGILVAFNFALICIAAFIIDARRTHHLLGETFSFHVLGFSAALLIIGLIKFFFTLCGFVGVLRENIVLIRIFYISLIVLMCVACVMLVFTLVFATATRVMLSTIIGHSAVTKYRADTDIETSLDYLQVTFGCCGLSDSGFKDWNASIYYNCSTDNPSAERCGVPWSCCRNATQLDDPLCGSGVLELDRNIASRKVHTRGCLMAFQSWCAAHAVIIAIVLILELIFLFVLIFQSIQVVNELQMMTKVYRGPWWVWVGKKRSKRKVGERPPAGTFTSSSSSSSSWQEIPSEARTPSDIQTGPDNAQLSVVEPFIKIDRPSTPILIRLSSQLTENFIDFESEDVPPLKRPPSIFPPLPMSTTNIPSILPQFSPEFPNKEAQKQSEDQDNATWEQLAETDHKPTSEQPQLQGQYSGTKFPASATRSKSAEAKADATTEQPLKPQDKPNKSEAPSPVETEKDIETILPQVKIQPPDTESEIAQPAILTVEPDAEPYVAAEQAAHTPSKKPRKSSFSKFIPSKIISGTLSLMKPSHGRKLSKRIPFRRHGAPTSSEDHIDAAPHTRFSGEDSSAEDLSVPDPVSATRSNEESVSQTADGSQRKRISDSADPTDKPGLSAQGGPQAHEGLSSASERVQDRGGPFAGEERPHPNKGLSFESTQDQQQKGQGFPNGEEKSQDRRPASAPGSATEIGGLPHSPG